ncbi:hypothetical protein [Vibrio owensii]|uniref:hypothetical protein n=1 Tax=Vibrio harveyi group TaxID=717610 RepID=UPI003CC6B53D
MKHQIGRIDALILDRSVDGNIHFSSSTLLNRDFIAEALGTSDPEVAEFFAHHIEESLFRLGTVYDHAKSLQDYYDSLLAAGEGFSTSYTPETLKHLVLLVAISIKKKIILEGLNELLHKGESGENPYCLLTEYIINLICPGADVSSDFLESALEDDISIHRAIHDWFIDEGIQANLNDLEAYING